jgi:hypothetical protein
MFELKTLTLFVKSSNLDIEELFEEMLLLLEILIQRFTKLIMVKARRLT